MDTYPVTVVIPVRNMEATLKRAMSSALDAGAMQVFIMDDYSTDDTAKVAYQYHRTNIHRVKTPGVISKCATMVPSGVVHVRNYGVAWAMTDLIVCLDADDTLTPESLKALYEAYEPGTWVYGGWRDISEEDVHMVTHPAPPPAMIDRKNLCHATFLFAKEDWRKVGGFDPDFSLGIEDYAFQVALTNAGIRPKRVDSIIYNRTVGVNERSKKATRYYPFLFQVLQDKYPKVFQK